MTGSAATSTVRTRRAVLGLVGACHPAPTAAVTTVAVLLAGGVGLGLRQVLVFGAAVLTGQLSIGWSNDRIDAARDLATGREDKPAAAGRVPLLVLSTAAGLALVATVLLSVTLGGWAATAALTLVAAGWAYNLGVKATVFSGVAYVIGFGALPAAPYLALPGHPWPPWWAPTTGALLGLGAHFANVLPDLRDDAATGVRGLPQRLGPRRGVLVMAIALAAASIVLGFGPVRASAAFGVVVASVGVLAGATALVLATHRPESAAAFRVTLLMAVLDVVLFVVVTR